MVLPNGRVRAKILGRTRRERRGLGLTSCADSGRESFRMVVARRSARARARAWPSSGGRLGARAWRPHGRGASRRRRVARPALLYQTAEESSPACRPEGVRHGRHHVRHWRVARRREGEPRALGTPQASARPGTSTDRSRGRACAGLARRAAGSAVASLVGMPLRGLDRSGEPGDGSGLRPIEATGRRGRIGGGWSHRS